MRTEQRGLSSGAVETKWAAGAAGWGRQGLRRVVLPVGILSFLVAVLEVAVLVGSGAGLQTEVRWLSLGSLWQGSPVLCVAAAVNRVVGAPWVTPVYWCAVGVITVVTGWWSAGAHGRLVWTAVLLLGLLNVLDLASSMLLWVRHDEVVRMGLDGAVVSDTNTAYMMYRHTLFDWASRISALGALVLVGGVQAGCKWKVDAADLQGGR